jgi:hypothetical protein
LHITLVIVSVRASHLVRSREAELVAREQAMLVPLRQMRLVWRQQGRDQVRHVAQRQTTRLDVRAGSRCLSVCHVFRGEFHDEPEDNGR